MGINAAVPPYEIGDDDVSASEYTDAQIATHRREAERAHSLARRGEEPPARMHGSGPRHGSGSRSNNDRTAGDVHTRLMQRVLRQRAGLPSPHGASAVPQSQGDSFIMYANGSECVGGGSCF